MRLNEQRLIYKIETKELKKNNWNINIDLHKVLKDYPEMVISIGESQLIRWLDELKQVKSANAEISKIKTKIRNKKKSDTRKSKMEIKKLYDDLYNLEFLPDLISVVMNTKSDYDRANKGFYINGIRFRRLIGTSGGIKNSTIFFINEDLHAEIMRRIENGRNLNTEIVPAKLEAYRALTCSGSIPIPQPNGIIVVKDCITKFKENVIMIDDTEEGEPKLTHVSDYEFNHNNSDGFGLMLPSYAVRVNEYLSGDNTPISGMNTRYAFEKGMLFTFDYLEFAEQIANNYIITDVWGAERDIRNAEVILTESMLKLWAAYASWEDYKQKCDANNYDFCVCKVCPNELEPVRTTNYQFINPLELSDKEITQLCKPTINEIKDIIALDPRKTITYLLGKNLKENKIFSLEQVKSADDCIPWALIIEPKTIEDPYIRKRIYSNIQKQIERTKRGKISINANYAIISGDPFALCQSIFGLEITGLLKAGEVYHRYWIDKGAKEIACFRAPMTVGNSIRKLNLSKSENAAHWFKYIKTGCILNAWDSTAEAANGADFDSDTFYCTDNSIILNNIENKETIVCVQKPAEKKIPTEKDIIKANKLAFNDDIGAITNVVTAMYDVRETCEKGGAEYKELTYRIMCGQLLQQNAVDRAKGIISKPMPKRWKKNTEGSTDFDRAICANKKPYFMIFVYPELKNKYQDFYNSIHRNAVRKTGLKIEELTGTESEDAAKIISDMTELNPVTDYGCTVNRIAHFVESQFRDFKESATERNFDYTILKSEKNYTKIKFNGIAEIYKDYKVQTSEFEREAKNERISKEQITEHKKLMIETFRRRCEMVCPNEEELSNILIDLVYTCKRASKSFAWEICGKQIIKNLLQRNGGKMYIPVLTNKDEDFLYQGIKFRMNEANYDKTITTN